MNEQDRRDFLGDGRSAERRADFRAVREFQRRRSAPLVEHLRFLDGLQQVFGAFEVDRPTRADGDFRL